jgi:hypothetical protein
VIYVKSYKACLVSAPDRFQAGQIGDITFVPAGLPEFFPDEVKCEACRNFGSADVLWRVTSDYDGTFTLTGVCPGKQPLVLRAVRPDMRVWVEAGFPGDAAYAAGTRPLTVTFNDKHCGKILFTSYHTEGRGEDFGDNRFPDYCGAMSSPQDRVLELMVFDIAQCLPHLKLTDSFIDNRHPGAHTSRSGSVKVRAPLETPDM